MDREIDKLLGKLCVDLGFCLPPKEQDRIASKVFWESTDFAKEVVSSEGLNPEYESRWVREIRNRFINHFGSNEYSSENS